MDKLQHEKFMKRCLSLALKAEGFTNPNPMVGCVIVKNGKIIAQGYHKKYGFPHAEAEALKKAAEKAKGAVLYVNLEPCDHYGNTPPCSDLIIKSGIKSVIYSMKDPNPINNGKGIKKLKENGINVKGNILKKQAEELNKIYIKFITQKIPYISVKAAQSLDGKIATKNKHSKWISSEKSLKFSQYLRNKSDAVLVGINTVAEDNPTLVPKNIKNIKKIKRVVLDSCLKIKLSSNLVKTAGKFPVIVFTTLKAKKTAIEKLKNKGVEVIVLKTKNINIKTVLKILAGKKIAHLLVEGGGNVIYSFFKSKKVDDFFWFVCPKIIGGQDAVTSAEGKGVSLLRDAEKLEFINIKNLSGDILIYGKPWRE